jgi:hypothetical protein
MRCDCQKLGVLCSGVAGILSGVPNRRGRRYIERCDACERFHSDEVAGLEYARIKGGGCRYDESRRVLWSPG